MTLTETNQDHLFLSTLSFAAPCFFFFFLWFSCGREKAPFVFKPNVAENLLTDVESKSSCSFCILQSVYSIPHDYILDSCGFDAYCYIKTLKACFYVFLLTIPGVIGTSIVYFLANGVQDKHQGYLPAFTIGNVDSGSPQLWASFVMVAYVCLVTIIVFQRLLKNLHVKADKQHLTLRPESYSVLIDNIDAHSSKEAFIAKLESLFGMDMVEVRLMEDIKSVLPYFAKVQAARNTYDLISKEGDRSCCGCCCRMDIDKASDHQNQMEDLFFMINLGHLETTDVAIATFGMIRSAVECANSIMIPGGTNILTRMCPAKDDIIWENLNVEASTRTFLQGVVVVLYLFLIVMFTPIMIFIQGLVNLEQLAQSGIPGISWVGNLSEELKSTIEGLVPVLLFSLFFVFLPSILYKIVGITRPLSHTDHQGSVLPKYADCLIGMGLLVTFFAGAVLSDISDLLEPAKFIGTLGMTVPQESTFYIDYILNAGFFGLGLEMANLGRFFSVIFFGPQEQTPMLYYRGYPQIIMIFTVCITYAAISPIILIWGLIYFFLAYIISKHQILYVYKIHRHSQLWHHWPIIYQRLHVALLIGMLVILGVFTLKDGMQQIPCIVFIGTLTYGFYHSQLRTYSHYFKQPCLDSSWEHDMKHGPQDWHGNTLYLPDCIKELRRKRPPRKEKSYANNLTMDTMEAPLLKHNSQGPEETPPRKKRLPSRDWKEAHE